MKTGNDSKLLKEFLNAKSEGKVKDLEVKDYVSLLDYVNSTSDDKVHIPEILESAEKLYPNEYSIKHWKINYLLGENRAKEALEYMESLPVDNDNEDYIVDLASCYINLKMYSKIHDKCKELDSLYCDTVLTFVDYIIEKLMPYMDDKDVLDIASKISKYSDSTWGMEELDNSDMKDGFHMSDIYDTDGHNKAIEYGEGILKQDPYNGYIWMKLGEIYLDMEDYDKAIESFDFALAIAYKKKKYAYIIYECMMEKADSLMYKGSYIKAIEVLQEMLDETKFKVRNDDCVYQMIGTCYYNMEEYDKSYDNYTTAYKINPRTCLFGHFVEYFISCVHTQRFQEAKDLMSQYKSINPIRKDVEYSLNKILKNLNIGRSGAKAINDELSKYDLVNDFLLEKSNRN